MLCEFLHARLVQCQTGYAEGNEHRNQRTKPRIMSQTTPNRVMLVIFPTACTLDQRGTYSFTFNCSLVARSTYRRVVYVSWRTDVTASSSRTKGSSKYPVKLS